MNVMNAKARLKRTSPVLLLLGVLVVGAVGAAILYWSSDVITAQHGFTVTGLTGAAMQVIQDGEESTNIINSYKAKTIATTLDSFSIGTDPIHDADDAFMLVYVDGNTDLSSGLVINLDVTITGPGAEEITYTATGKYGLFFYNSFSSSDMLYTNTVTSTVTFVDGVATIPNSETELLTYDETLPVYGQDAETVGKANCLFIEFLFSGGSGAELSWGNYIADIEIVASLGTA